MSDFTLVNVVFQRYAIDVNFFGTEGARDLNSLGVDRKFPWSRPLELDISAGTKLSEHRLQT